MVGKPPVAPTRASGAISKQPRITSLNHPVDLPTSNPSSSTSPRPPLLSQPISTPRPPHSTNKPPTYRIQLKKIDPTTPILREKIFQTCFEHLNAPLIRLTDTLHGYNAITDDPNTIDKLTSPRATELFKSINLTAVIPPDLRAKRTVFVRSLDSHVGSRTEEEIKTEISKHNHSLKIARVIKIKQFTHILKIVTQDTNSTNKILSNGFYAFHTKITPFQCEPESYTQQCTSTTTVCSECASNDHTFKDCTSPHKRCLNCSQPHRTLANNCPIRKQKIAEKQATENQKRETKSNTTFATITKTQPETTPSNHTSQSITLTSNVQLKIAALVIEAHIACLKPGSNFSNTLSESLKLNFNIDTKFPDRDSNQIFNVFFNPSTTSTSNVTPTAHDTDSHTLIELNQPSLTPLDISDSMPPASDLATHLHSSPPLNTDSQPILRPTPSHAHHTAHPRHTLDPMLGMDVDTDSATQPDTLDEIPPPLPAKRKAQTSPNSAPSASLDPLDLRFYRSDSDPNPIPENPPNTWYINELQKDIYGLKASVENHSPATFFNLINTGRYDLSKTRINLIDHSNFMALDKITRIKTTSKKPRKTSERRSSK